MYGMETFYCALQPEEILNREATANVHVLGNKRDAMGHRGETADNNELNVVMDQTLQQQIRVLHAIPPSPVVA